MDTQHFTDEAIEKRVPPESKVLNIVAPEVPVDEISSNEIQSLVDMLFKVAYGRQGDRKYPTLVGLAAP